MSILIWLGIAYVVVATAEFILSITWNTWYFESGFVVFSRNINFDISLNVNDIRLDALEYAFSEGWTPCIKFSLLNNGNIGFREQIFQLNAITYPPLMHGVISIDHLSKKIYVNGRINWMTMLIPPLLFCILVSDIAWVSSNEIVISAVLIIPISISYFIQAYRFKKVVRLLDEGVKQ